MLRLLADEDFDNDILRGVLRRVPTLDVVRVQDLGLKQSADSIVLEHAARERRVVLTHDVNTMVAAGYARVTAGLPFPGLFAVPQTLAVAQAIDDIVLLAECSSEDEWAGQVRYLPL
jgi:hypothetical protein